MKFSLVFSLIFFVFFALTSSLSANDKDILFFVKETSNSYQADLVINMRKNTGGLWYIFYQTNRPLFILNDLTKATFWKAVQAEKEKKIRFSSFGKGKYYYLLAYLPNMIGNNWTYQAVSTREGIVLSAPPGFTPSANK